MGGQTCLFTCAHESGHLPLRVEHHWRSGTAAKRYPTGTENGKMRILLFQLITHVYFSSGKLNVCWCDRSLISI